jgi:hypothetical protein
VIHTPIFAFDGVDCTAYRSVAEAETDIEPPEVADAVLFGADGARLRLVLGPHTSLPERPRWWRAAWKGPAVVLVQESGAPPMPGELAERLRAYLAAAGDEPGELAALGLETLVGRAAARAS